MRGNHMSALERFVNVTGVPQDQESLAKAERIVASFIQATATTDMSQLAVGACLALACFTHPDRVEALLENGGDTEVIKALAQEGMDEAEDIAEMHVVAHRIASLTLGVEEEELEAMLEASEPGFTRVEALKHVEELIMERMTE